MAHKILIIEGDRPFSQELAGSLGGRGYDVLTAHDEKEGLSLATSSRPDAVVLSVELAHGSGFTVCARLKKDPGLRGIPVVLTSGAGRADILEQHRNLPTRADEYLHKPFTPEKLDGILRRLLHDGATDADVLMVEEVEVASVDDDAHADIVIEDIDDVAIEVDAVDAMAIQEGDSAEHVIDVDLEGDLVEGAGTLGVEGLGGGDEDEDLRRLDEAFDAIQVHEEGGLPLAEPDEVEEELGLDEVSDEGPAGPPIDLDGVEGENSGRHRRGAATRRAQARAMLEELAAEARAHGTTMDEDDDEGEEPPDQAATVVANLDDITGFELKTDARGTVPSVPRARKVRSADEVAPTRPDAEAPARARAAAGLPPAIVMEAPPVAGAVAAAVVAPSEASDSDLAQGAAAGGRDDRVSSRAGLHANAQKLLDRITSLRERLTAAENENGELRSRWVEAENKWKRLQGEMDSKDEEILTSSTRLKTMEGEIEHLERERDARIAEAQARSRDLARQLDEAKREGEELRRRAAQVPGLETEVQKERNAHQAEKRRAHALEEDLSQAKDALIGARDRLQAEVDAQRKARDKAEEALAEAGARAEALERDLATARADLQARDERLGTLERRVPELERELSASTAELDEARADVGSLRGERDALAQQIETERGVAARELEATRARAADELSTTVAARDGRIAQLDAEVTSGESRIEELTRELARREDAMRTTEERARQTADQLRTVEAERDGIHAMFEASQSELAMLRRALDEERGTLDRLSSSLRQALELVAGLTLGAGLGGRNGSPEPAREEPPTATTAGGLGVAAIGALGGESVPGGPTE